MTVGPAVADRMARVAARLGFRAVSPEYVGLVCPGCGQVVPAFAPPHMLAADRLRAAKERLADHLCFECKGRTA